MMFTTGAVKAILYQRCVSEMQPSFNETAFEKNIAVYLDDLRVRFEPGKFAANFQKLCPLKNAVTTDYNLKVLPLAGQEFALSSLRFFALRPEEPFVMIEFCSYELNAANILPVIEIVQREYAHLEIPRFHFTCKENIAVINLCTVTRDKVLVKGLITANRSNHFDNKLVHLLPLPCMSDEQYLQYLYQLELFLNHQPNLRGQLHIEKRGYLELLGTAGFLFEIQVEGRFAGFMAVDEGFEQGCYGLAIIEEFLFEKYHGLGYGKVIQSKLIDALADSGWAGTYLFGSIASTNIPSLKTAAANKRMPFATSYFVEQMAKSI